MKIRLKLSLWYFFVTLGILLLFSLGTYWIMQRLLFYAVDKEHDVVADSIEKSYDPKTGRFKEFTSDTTENSFFDDYYLEVYDTNSNLIYKSKIARHIDMNLSEIGTSRKDGFNVTINGNETFKLGKPGLPNGQANYKNEITFRVTNHNLFYNRTKIGKAIIGLSIESTEKSMENLFNALLIAVIFVVILIAGGGYFLTKKSLLPVEIITERAKQISSSTLNERIKIDNSDELGKLSKVLNDLLDRLEKSFQSQHTFMADAAHELKTPLSILRAHWENELNNPELSLEMKEKLVRDIETISRLTHLINNLLLLTKTENVSAGFSFSIVEISSIIKEVISNLQLLADNKYQSLVVNRFQEAFVHGDRMRLYQLFFNVIDNAIRYTPDRGSIWIDLRKDKNEVIISIKNNGTGIPEQDLPHIFDRFYRVEKDRARKTGGSGLGLAICKLITEIHKGKIEVESKAGLETIFRIFLPLTPLPSHNPE
jgi:two-component system sensor histidine kinase ArlS